MATALRYRCRQTTRKEAEKNRNDTKNQFKPTAIEQCWTTIEGGRGEMMKRNVAKKSRNVAADNSDDLFPESLPYPKIPVVVFNQVHLSISSGFLRQILIKQLNPNLTLQCTCVQIIHVIQISHSFSHSMRSNDIILRSIDVN